MGMNVLVVTDATWIENDVRASLTDPSTRIARVSDPTAVVAAVAEHQVEVAVIDIQVGSSGGMSIVRDLRSAMEGGVIGPVRTVMLLDREADRFLSRRAGADVAVVKPFTAQELRAAADVGVLA